MIDSVEYKNELHNMLKFFRDDMNAVVANIIVNPMKMYEAGIFTGLMNKLDPASPHCCTTISEAVISYSNLSRYIYKYAYTVEKREGAC